ncbi:MAG: MFS transporter [Rhodospirillaceae bacterium]|jgi:MFS family permease|nr:MFS transporter [Rhodospirillaceae bacterium]
MATQSKFGGIGRALQHRNYRYYWMGGAVSILGFWLHKLALGWLTWELTHSPFWLGIIGFSATFVTAIIAPFAGAVADRFGLRKIAFIALSCSSANAMTVAIVTYSGAMTIELLVILTLIQGITLSFDLPARQALVHHIVDREDLSAAIALNTTTFHVGAFVGPALFGLVTSIWDTYAAFFINSLTFFAFAIALAVMKLEPRPPREKDGSTIFGDMVDGVRYTFNHPGIFALLSLTAASHLLLRPYIDLLPAFADTIFGLGEGGFAALAGASGMGSLVGGTWLAIRGKTEGLTRLLTLGILGSGMAMFVFAATNIYPLALACMAFLGFSLVTMAVASQSLVQNAVDSSKRARVISLSTGMAVGFPALGALILGSIGDVLGVQIPVLVAAAICLLYWFWASKRLRRQSDLMEAEPEK